MGFSDEAIKEELEQEDDSEICEIWPEHMDVWNLFSAVQHQWRTPPFGGKPFGLEYPAVQTAMGFLFPRKQHRELFQQLQLIEAGALKAWPSK